MNKQVQSIYHGGKYILFSDYAGLQGSQFIDYINEHYSQHRKIIEKGGNNLLILTDIKGCTADREVMKLMKQTVKINGPSIKKSAVIGVDGLQRVLLNAINRFSAVDTKVFSSKPDAIEWLAKE